MTFEDIYKLNESEVSYGQMIYNALDEILSKSQGNLIEKDFYKYVLRAAEKLATKYFEEQENLKENIEGDIYSSYLYLINNGFTDREARFQLSEEFGYSEDNYASLIDTIEASNGSDNSS